MMRLASQCLNVSAGRRGRGSEEDGAVLCLVPAGVCWTDRHAAAGHQRWTRRNPQAAMSPHQLQMLFLWLQWWLSAVSSKQNAVAPSTCTAVMVGPGGSCQPSERCCTVWRDDVHTSTRCTAATVVRRAAVNLWTNWTGEHHLITGIMIIWFTSNQFYLYSIYNNTRCLCHDPPST